MTFRPTIEALKHPELRDGEVFLENATKNQFDTDYDWGTRRLGEVAYDVTTGDKIQELRPIFVQRAELEKFGFTIVD